VARATIRRNESEQRRGLHHPSKGLPSSSPSAPSSLQEIRSPALQAEKKGSQKPSFLDKLQTSAPTTSSATYNVFVPPEDLFMSDSPEEDKGLGTVPTNSPPKVKNSVDKDPLTPSKRSKRKNQSSPVKLPSVTRPPSVPPQLAGARTGKPSLFSSLPARLSFQALYDLLTAKYMVESNWQPPSNGIEDLLKVFGRAMVDGALKAIELGEDPYAAAIARLEECQKMKSMSAFKHLKTLTIRKEDLT